LLDLLPMSPDEASALEDLEERYKISIPPYYFSLINTSDPNDPIRIQSVPSPLENESEAAGLQDPLDEDRDMPVPGLTHRYPDRALLVTTPVCSMYCRFCTRKRVTMDREGWDGPTRDEEAAIEYLREHRQIRDLILSGGDPLMLPPAKLRWFLENLAAIPHLDVIRVGTRVPVTLPCKLFDPALVDLLASTGKIWIQTHFNHPREITPESQRAVRNLINHGMPVNNHSVLLRGVNDSVSTMRKLVRGLLRIKARPYYLFHCDPVVGVGHLRTSVWKGVEIIEGLRGHVSGLAVPTFVVDGLHGAGKVPLMPNYLVSASEDAVILRNYEGMLFRYAPKPETTGPEGIMSVGVSGILSGSSRGRLVPEGTPRFERRREREAAAEAAGDELVVITLPENLGGSSRISSACVEDGRAVIASIGPGGESHNGHSDDRPSLPPKPSKGRRRPDGIAGPRTTARAPRRSRSRKRSGS
jgi:lysine 2,3-aminomutase